MKRRIRRKPSKASAGMSFAMGIVFVIIGLTVVIPASFRSGFLPVGLFGFAWTGFAAAITVTNGMYLFGKRESPDLFDRYEIEDVEEGERSPFDAAPPPAASQPSPEARLRQLEELREKRLITANEFEEKRKEILKEL